MDINSKIENYEEKLVLAQKIAQKIKNNDVIGFGSGTTSYLAVEAIGERIKKEKIKITAVTTSSEIELLCHSLGIITTDLKDADINWAFDGADEVDENNNLIKGMGAAMFKEKLNFVSSPKIYLLVDKSKFVSKLGEKHPIPVECTPSSIKYVAQQLIHLGAKSYTFRKKDNKLVYTDSGNLIIDAWFDSSLINKKLEENIKLIVGVIESGLFMEYKNIEIL